jgi:hypothetical protein
VPTNIRNKASGVWDIDDSLDEVEDKWIEVIIKSRGMHDMNKGIC